MLVCVLHFGRFTLDVMTSEFARGLEVRRETKILKHKTFCHWLCCLLTPCVCMFFVKMLGLVWV